MLFRSIQNAHHYNFRNDTAELPFIDEGTYFGSEEKLGMSTTAGIEATAKIIPFAKNEDKTSKLPTRSIHMNVRSIIQLGLYLQILSKFQNKVNFISITKNRNLQMISDRCKSLLSSKLAYYPVKALEPLWREIPNCNFPDCSSMYRDLCRHVSHSLSVDPIQIKNQESLIKSLLRSMTVSNITDRKLISELFDIYDKCGYNKKKYGRCFENKCQCL